MEGGKPVCVIGKNVATKFFSQGEVVGNFIDEADGRGMKTYVQMAPSHLPKLRGGLDESERMDDMPRMPDGSLPGERMVNFAAIASPSVQEFFAAQARDVLMAYPNADAPTVTQ